MPLPAPAPSPDLVATPTPSHDPVPAPARSRSLLALTVLSLAAALLYPSWPQARGATIAVVVAVGLAAAVTALRAQASRGGGGPNRVDVKRRPVRAGVDLLMYLSPVLLLTVAYPFAVAQMGASNVAGVPLPTLLLASSLTIPWMSVAVCLPLYRSVGHLLPDGDLREIRNRFCTVWPATFVQTAPLILLFAVPLEIAMRWPLTAWLTYIGLCLTHAAFSQSLVLANIGRQRFVWASAWIGYTAVLLLFPTVWFLPPLVGLATQLVVVRRHLPRLWSRARLEHADVAADMGRGVLLGAVLWAHLLLLFVKTSGQFAVTTLFIGALAAVISYNYYFVRLAPEFDRAVLSMRTAMEQQPHHRLREHSRMLARVVDASLLRTGALCAVLGFGVTVVVQQATQSPAELVAVVAVASWLFMMTTLACYKLDYIGHSGQAQVFSGVHLGLSLVAFVVLPSGPVLYAWLIVLSAVVFVGALHACRRTWGASDYSLFWRHATAW